MDFRFSKGGREKSLGNAKKQEEIDTSKYSYKYLEVINFSKP